jgi:hypothetical protein
MERAGAAATTRDSVSRRRMRIIAAPTPERFDEPVSTMPATQPVTDRYEWDYGPPGYGVGRGNGVGRGRGLTLGVGDGGGSLGVGDGEGVTDGVTVGVADGVTDGVTVGVGVTGGVTVGVGVGVGEGVGPPAAQKISIEATGTPVVS